MSITDNSFDSKRLLPYIFIVDNSTNMAPGISQLNEGLCYNIDSLKDISFSLDDTVLKIAVLQCGGTPHWMSGGLVEAEKFVYEPMKASGELNIGASLTELNNKLTRNGGFMQTDKSPYLPIIIFAISGYASDNYQKALNAINQNKWFRSATKIGIAMGDNPDCTMIANIVGNVEAVIRIDDNLSTISHLIRFELAKSSNFSDDFFEVSDFANVAEFVDCPPVPVDDPWCDPNWDF